MLWSLSQNNVDLRLSVRNDSNTHRLFDCVKNASSAPPNNSSAGVVHFILFIYINNNHRGQEPATDMQRKCDKFKLKAQNKRGHIYSDHN